MRAPWFVCWVTLVVLGGSVGHASAANDPRVHVVEIESMKFSPSALQLNVGDRVHFKNVDLVPHTVTARGKREPAGLDSGVIQPGATWSWTASKSGSVPYACTLHPRMQGELTVSDAGPNRGAHAP